MSTSRLATRWRTSPCFCQMPYTPSKGAFSTSRRCCFAAHYGVGGWIAEAQGTPVEWAFCRFAVRDRTDFVVEDAHVHERVKDNPLVTVDGLRCYAGIPLITSRGHALGSFCVAGTEARSFDEAEMKVLRDLAAEAIRRIEDRRAVAA